MINAILVDDEFLTVEALKKIIKNGDNDISIIGEAYDGLDALKIIENDQPDMAIVDIRMPNMDGLELMKQIKEKGLNTKVIVLSAYRDFEYARQAIQYGAFGYLVKPIDKARLFQEINNLKQKIDEEKSVIKLRDIVRESIPLVKEKYFRQLLNGTVKYSEKSSEGKYQIDIDEQNCQLMLVSISGLQCVDPDSSQDSAAGELIMKCMEGELREKTKVQALITEKDELTVIFNTTEALNSIDLANNLINSLRQLLQADVNVALSSKGFSLDDINCAYREARIALIYRFYMGLNSVIAFERVKEIQFLKNSILFENEDYLIEQIKMGISDEVMHIFNQMYNSLKQNMNMNPEMVYNAYYEFIFYLKKALKDTNVEKELKVQLSHLELENLKCYLTLDQLSDFIRQTIISIISFIENSRKSDDSRLIEKVKCFCEENYSKDITLDLISEHVNMAKNYFCSLFKKKIGESFWDYLTNLRISKAKMFLETTEMKIGVISEKVGYKNSSHFCRIFKETVGVSPAEYKERVLRR